MVGWRGLGGGGLWKWWHASSLGTLLFLCLYCFIASQLCLFLVSNTQARVRFSFWGSEIDQSYPLELASYWFPFISFSLSLFPPFSKEKCHFLINYIIYEISCNSVDVKYPTACMLKVDLKSNMGFNLALIQDSLLECTTILHDQVEVNSEV